MSKKRKRRRGHAHSSKRELRKKKRKRHSKHKDRSYYIRKEMESREEEDWKGALDSFESFDLWVKKQDR